jgi:hypothetical protein
LLFIHGWFIVVVIVLYLAVVHLVGYLDSARKAIDAVECAKAYHRAIVVLFVCCWLRLVKANFNGTGDTYAIGAL